MQIWVDAIQIPWYYKHRQYIIEWDLFLKMQMNPSGNYDENPSNSMRGKFRKQ